MSYRSPSPPAFSSKFEMVVSSQRRSPPTALRLISGPLPSRNKPKHTLPSLPRPAFYPKAHITHGPTPRRRAPNVNAPVEEPYAHMTYQELPPLVINMGDFGRRSMESGASSPVSAGSNNSYPPSPPPERTLRGPWDHSGSIHVPFDVEAVLAPPRPVAVNTGGR